MEIKTMAGGGVVGAGVNGVDFTSAGFVAYRIGK